MSEHLSKQASRGLAWSLAAHLAVLAVSVAAQLVLGWLLRDRDFGTYALAMAFCEFFGGFKDGGIGLWLVRLSPEQFNRQSGPAFWLSTVAGLISGLVVAASSFIVADIYDNSQIQTLMLIVALTMPFSAYSIVAASQLQVQMRIPALVGTRLASSVLRYALAVTFAVLGWGPLSFVLPLVFVVAFENLVLFAATRNMPWYHPFRWSECVGLFRDCRRTLWGTLSSVVFRQSDYVVLGMVTTTEVVGTYFFAYQLANQLMQLFGESLRKVTIPLFARLESDSERSTRGLLLAGLVQGLIATPALMSLAVAAPALEQLLWHGRWSAAVPAISLLAMAMPFNLAGFFVNFVAQARARFDIWTIAAFLRGIGFGVAVWIASLMGHADDPTMVAAYVASYIVVSGVVETILVLWFLRLPPWGLLSTLVPAAAVAAGMVILFDSFRNVFPSTPAVQLAVIVPVYLATVLICYRLLFPVAWGVARQKLLTRK